MAEMNENAPLRIITRDEWGAAEPLFSKFLRLPVEHVFFEYTYSNECDNIEDCKERVRSIQRYNLRLRENPDIRYNFLIASDGTVFEGRGWEAVPRLPQKWSGLKRKAHFIAMIGTFVDNPPSNEMFQTRSDLVKLGVSLHYIHTRHLEYNVSPQLTYGKQRVFL